MITASPRTISAKPGKRMHTPLMILASVCLCLAAWWAGGRLGESTDDRKPAPSPDEREEVTFPTGPLRDQERDQRTNQLIARTTTPALWKALKTYYRDRDLIKELIERLGVAAVLEHLLQPGDEATKLKGLKGFGEYLATKDPALLRELIRKHPADFTAEVFNSFSNTLTSASALSSADDLIDVARLSSQLGNLLMPGRLEFAPNFNFQKALDYAMDRKSGQPDLDGALLSGWARQHPAAAAKWLTEHIAETSDSVQGPVGSSSASLSAAVWAISQSAAKPDERVSSYAILEQLPQQDIQKAWQSIYVGSSHQPLKAGLLEAATAMGERQEYLRQAFDALALLPDVAPEWATVVTPDEGKALMAGSDAAWAASKTTQQVTPLQEEMHQNWRARMSALWKGE